jgi:phenylacetate-CoA ligase
MRRWLIRNLAFPFHEWLKGHPTHEILREMEAADQMPAPELEQLSAARLRDLIRDSYAHVPYIRASLDQAGVRPSEIHSPADLARLPVMTKADVRANRENLRSRKAGKLSSYSTTGSTGDPLIFDLSKRRIASRVACRQRVTRWWGLSVGDPEFVLWGAPAELTRQDWLRDLRDRFLSTKLLSAFEMNEPVMAGYLDTLQRHGCRMIFGYPSALSLLCLYARKRGVSLRRLGLKAAFVTGEPLWPTQREVISETLNCPVADGYGGRDSGFLSHECPQGGMHILSDAVIVEVVDPEGRPLPPGESGEIVATDLYSHGVPFIRYATGDRGVLSKERCRCGRALPLLEKIEGRIMEFFLTPDGRTIPGGSVFYAFYGIDGIDQFKVVQKKIDSFHIQIVAGAAYRVEHEARIRQGLIRRMRAPVEVTFEYLPSFPVDPTGKFRCVVSEVAGISPVSAR